MTYPLQIRGLSDEQYVHALRSAYAGMRLYDPSIALHEDPDIDEKMLRDIHIAAMWQKRVRKVAGRKYTIEPGDKTPAAVTLAALVTEALADIQSFTQSRQELASKSIWGGRGYQFIAHRGRCLRRLAGTAPQNWLLPVRLDDIESSRIRFDPVRETDPATGKTTIRTVAKFWPLEIVGQPRELSAEDAKAIVWATFGDEERRLGYGRGLRDPLYFAFYAKFQLIQGGLNAAETWARGLTIAKLDAETHGSTEQTNAQIAQDFLSVLKKTRAEHVLAIDSRDEVEVVWPSGEGWRMFMEGIRYWDDRISALLLASVLPTGGGDQGKGSLSRAETEADSEDDLISGDQEVLDGAWTRGLIGWFLHMNQAQLRALGLAGVKSPKFSSGGEKIASAEARTAAVKTAVELGADVLSDEFYLALGLTKPPTAGPVIRGRQAPAPGMFPPPGMEEKAVAKFEEETTV